MSIQHRIASFVILIVLGAAALSAGPAKAVTGRCLAMAESAPDGLAARVIPAALKANEVEITFVGHSTFRITSPGGTIIVTDYAGHAGEGRVPDVATMNHAHESHYTDFPDPAIPHVLRGWNPAGGPAEHSLVVGDVSIRNVPTDIRHWSGIREKDGNSIFIFEVAELCIGHLGHLHHELTPEHLGWIGFLDVVMVPVDGGFTMAQDAMLRVLKDLRARLILPMHYFGPPTLERFLDKMGEAFAVEVNPTPTIILTRDTLPRRAKLLILPGY